MSRNSNDLSSNSKSKSPDNRVHSRSKSPPLDAALKMPNKLANLPKKS
jgi:hypothetical protein